MSDSVEQSATGIHQGGDIVGVPHCAVCDARESLRTPLTLQPDGSYLCAVHVRVRLREGIGEHGASALQADGASVPTTIATGRSAPPPDSPYEVLGVPQDASAEEIEAARKKAQQYWLPRRAGAQRGRAEEMLDRISVAFDDLTDPELRRACDERLRERALAGKINIVTVEVAPLEDWAGRRIVSLRDFVTACESSAQNWRIGEGILLNGGLLTWVRFSLRDIETARLIERTVKRSDLSNMRKLNDLLYRIDPERPYRFFSLPDAFEPVTESMSVQAIESLVKFADAHWDMSVQHLYDGELLTWLEARAPLGVYGSDYYDVRPFFEKHCQQFAHTKVAGVGLETLLEFLDPTLPQPQIHVAFDGQENGYSLANWDGELPHRAVTMRVENTTRGYYAGNMILTAPSAKEMSLAPWVSLTSLPATAMSARSPSTTTSTWDPKPQIEFCELRGATSRQFSFYLGNFSDLRRGRTYKRTITLERFATSPTRTKAARSFPVTLRLMRYLAGYRLVLWLRGLRGGIPGAILNGGVGYLIGWLLLLLGLVFTPHNFWAFFSHAQDFSHGQITGLGVLDIVLMLLLRPFYFAITVFGFQLPNLFGVFYGFFGFLTGWRRGHRQFDPKQDQDRISSVAWLLALFLWIAATVTIAFNVGQGSAPFYFIPAPGFHITGQVIAFVFESGNPPPQWNGFPFLAVFFSGVSAFVARKAIIAIRKRLYQWAQESAVSLLNPPDKG